MTEEALIEDRTNRVMADWPTLKHAWGCVNCDALFRWPLDGTHCPHCKSTGVFDAAAVLASERVPVSEVVQQALGMIHSLEEAISEAHESASQGSAQRDRGNQSAR